VGIFWEFATLTCKEIKMLPIKQMQANQLYLIEGTSVANSPFFESEADCKLFLSLTDKYLIDYLTINCFQNSRDGWVMIVTTKSAEAIRTAYENRRKQSKKCKEDCAHHETWRMLSDQIRILLSTYVKATNENTGRTGGKVSGKYKRFVFESLEEVEAVKKELLQLKYDQSQELARYQPSNELYCLQSKQSIYMGCALLESKELLRELGMRCLDLAGSLIHVLRQLVKTTFDFHFPLDPPILSLN